MGSGDGLVFIRDDESPGRPAVSAMAGGLPRGIEARAAPRKLVSGRVRLTTDTGGKLTGRLVDMSTSGFCAMMPDPVKIGIVCLVDCEVTVAGVPRTISAIAKTIHSILASGKGYRVGFQFQKISDGSAEVVRAVLR